MKIEIFILILMDSLAQGGGGGGLKMNFNFPNILSEFDYHCYWLVK